jgi:hypothetical protein
VDLRQSNAHTGHCVSYSTRIRLTLLSVFCAPLVQYLRLTILQFKAFQCAQLPDPVDASAWTDGSVPTHTSLYLVEDGSTLCYSREHLGIVIGVMIL